MLGKLPIEPHSKADWKADLTETPPFSQLFFIFLMYRFSKAIAQSCQQPGGTTKGYSVEEEFCIAAEEALLARTTN